jgi:hypothetical protein
LNEPPPRWLALVPAACLAVHVAVRRLPADLFWLCNVANVLLALGLAARWPRVVGVAFSWIAVGTGAWLIELVATGGELTAPTQFLTHLVSGAVGFVGVRRLGMPERTWVRALLGVLVLQVFSRAFTDPKENMNAAFEVYGYYKAVFPSYATYWLAMTALFAAVFFAIEKVMRLGQRSGSNPSGTAQVS